MTLIGSTSIDLSNYALKTDAMLKNNFPYLTSLQTNISETTPENENDLYALKIVKDSSETLIEKLDLSVLSNLEVILGFQGLLNGIDNNKKYIIHKNNAGKLSLEELSIDINNIDAGVLEVLE